jgi:replicative DNA helicase
MGQESSVERLPPQSIDAEVCLLGSLMIDNRAVGEVLPLLSSGCFYRPDHQRIYDAIVALYDRNVPVDVVLLREELARQGAPAELCDLDFLNTFTNSVPSAASALHYAKIVHEKAVTRALIDVCNNVARRCYQPEADAETLLDEAEQQIFKIAERKGLGEPSSIEELLQKAFDLIDNLQQNQIRGLGTGFAALDDLTGGLHGSEFIVIAGRPSMGKTTIACNILEHIAVAENKPVALFSLEMSKEQIAQNILCSHARIAPHKLRRGFLSKEDTNKLVMAAGALSEAPIYIDDPAGMSILELRAKARRIKSKHDVQLLVVDYMQLVSGTGRPENRQQEISQVSRGLKALAKELSIPVVAAAQLSRAPEAREGNQPRMSDLRESGSIEQDADVVLLLYREDYYSPEKRPGEADLILAKQRNGPTGKITLAFLKEIMRFENLHQAPAYSR